MRCWGSPEPQELRKRKIGHVVVSTRRIVPGPGILLHGGPSETFVTKHPVATKRMLRAVLKAAEMCALSRIGWVGPSWTRAC